MRQSLHGRDLLEDVFAVACIAFVNTLGQSSRLNRVPAHLASGLCVICLVDRLEGRVADLVVKLNGLCFTLWKRSLGLRSATISLLSSSK